jgi:hypothetical protein
MRQLPTRTTGWANEGLTIQGVSIWVTHLRR